MEILPSSLFNQVALFTITAPSLVIKFKSNYLLLDNHAANYTLRKISRIREGKVKSVNLVRIDHNIHGRKWFVKHNYPSDSQSAPLTPFLILINQAISF